MSFLRVWTVFQNRVVLRGAILVVAIAMVVGFAVAIRLLVIAPGRGYSGFGALHLSEGHPRVTVMLHIQDDGVSGQRTVGIEAVYIPDAAAEARNCVTELWLTEGASRVAPPFRSQPDDEDIFWASEYGGSRTSTTFLPKTSFRPLCPDSNSSRTYASSEVIHTASELKDRVSSGSLQDIPLRGSVVSPYYYPFDSEVYELRVSTALVSALTSDRFVVAPDLAGWVDPSGWEVQTQVSGESIDGAEGGSTLFVTYQRQLGYRLVFVVFCVVSLFVSSLLLTIKSMGDVSGVAITVLFGLWSIRDVTLASDITWPTIVDPIVAGLYLYLALILVARIVLLPLWQRLDTRSA